MLVNKIQLLCIPTKREAIIGITAESKAAEIAAATTISGQTLFSAYAHGFFYHGFKLSKGRQMETPVSYAWRAAV